jgi:membrane protease YdiL (CAAX protease family)
VSVFGAVDGLLQDGIAFLLLAYVFARQKRGAKSIGVEFRWSDPFKGFGLFILGAIVLKAFKYLVKSTDAALGISPDNRSVMHAGWKEHSITDLLGDISSPIFEEVLVRGYLMTEMLQLGKPQGAAIVASVVLQASYHLYYGWGTAIALSGFFLVLAVYFANSRRLTPVIYAHLSWDLIAYFSH